MSHMVHKITKPHSSTFKLVAALYLGPMKSLRAFGHILKEWWAFPSPLHSNQ